MKKLTVLGLFFMFVVSYGQNKRSLNNFREPSKEGINVFEAPKDTSIVKPFDGVKVRVGGSSALQFQALDHENGFVATDDPANPWYEMLPLIEIGDNFNLATANLDLDVALADGLRMHLRTYLSSRHHPEPYVKGGYLQIDNLNFIQEGMLGNLMKYVTVKIGHMENNYGDQHFRRSDNSSAIYNPFVGNTILDAFTTEVGGELYYRNNGWIAMVGVSNGKLNQAVNNPETTSPSLLGKLGYDKQVNEDLRVRLTGSIYNTAHASRVYLYSADRAGSRYYLVLEDEEANTTSNFRSGRYDPGFRNEVTAIMINPFVKYQGLEIFGLVEFTSGRADSEFEDFITFKQKKRDWTQLMVEVLYRFGSNENFYLGGRYNTASGEEAGSGLDVTIDRINFGGGVFLTKNVLAKLEYVSQTYDGFAPGNIYNDGKFSGVVFESVISF
ncbi:MULTISPECIES: hypothetical protein [Altibacter]|uniref:hypothetical protein n=1 Tax=Altibacter TaxID=1535231 RepID=UPI0009FC1DF3|nr:MULTISPECIES: hypothetical protein [Altibacter]MCW8981004.1 hypothetical protein [Altibacter sp.]MCW9037707.1 hypothetical protein [Altibacter sp.]